MHSVIWFCSTLFRGTHSSAAQRIMAIASLRNRIYADILGPIDLPEKKALRVLRVRGGYLRPAPSPYPNTSPEYPFASLPSPNPDGHMDHPRTPTEGDAPREHKGDEEWSCREHGWLCTERATCTPSEAPFCESEANQSAILTSANPEDNKNAMLYIL